MRLPLSHQKDAGHPWDGRPGFDLLVIEASTEAERDEVVAKAAGKFWKAWIVGFTANPERPDEVSSDFPSAVLYKPSGIMKDWVDHPDAPHPGCRDGVEIPMEEFEAWRRQVKRSREGERG